MPTICAVVLTYNRKNLLFECLEAISSQTRPCDRIVVVDNGGNDGTPEDVAHKFGGAVEIYHLPKNVGASGGFSQAMRIGYECGDDLLWVMDDDVIPASDALEQLLIADGHLRSAQIEAPFVISTAWTPDGELTNVPHIEYKRRNKIYYPVWPTFLSEGMVPIRRATFVSILLKRTILEEHGLPLADMFMWSEDTEFTLRLTRKEPGYLVGKSRVVHIRSAPGALDIRTEHDPVRIGWHYYLRRNRLYNTRRYRGLKAVARKFWNMTKLSLKLFASGQFHKAKVVAAGNWAGLFFKPSVEGVDRPLDLSELRYRPHVSPSVRQQVEEPTRPVEIARQG
jgi:dTDP-4-dehydrorhamnose reductase